MEMNCKCCISNISNVQHVQDIPAVSTETVGPKHILGTPSLLWISHDIHKRDGDPNIYFLPSAKILTSCKEFNAKSNSQLKNENSEM